MLWVLAGNEKLWGGYTKLSVEQTPFQIGNQDWDNCSAYFYNTVQ